MGTNDQWEAATMGYNNIGPNYWKGEEGRLALIAGEQKLTDPQWVAPLRDARPLGPTTSGDGFEAQTYPDSQNIFTLGPRRDLSGGLAGRSRASTPRPISRWAPSSRR